MSKASKGSTAVSEGGKTNPVRRFGPNDYKHIEERVMDVLEMRKRERMDLEKEWKEIDRQLAMTPELGHKKDKFGNLDPMKKWMPEVELPLQSQTLEVLVADAHRLFFPSNGMWFSSHALTTDEYFSRVDFASLIAGDTEEVPSLISQDNANKMVNGVVNHWHGQYDFPAHVDMINAEAFKYGAGVGRGRMVNKSVFMKTAKGIIKENQRIPVLVPRSIKNVYLDNSAPNMMNESYELGQSIISCKTMDYNDFIIGAMKGSDDPNSDTGGWIKSQIKKVEPNDKGHVELVEMEGDFSIPRKSTRGFFLPGIIVTVASSKSSKGVSNNLVRVRFRKDHQNSYIEFPYHIEDIQTAYPTSPLRKGWPIQKAACEALLQLMISASLNNLPPVSYDRNDTVFASRGGPMWFPGAQWGTMGDVKVHQSLGNPAALFNIYAGFLQQYADVTGVNAPRLGAQTVSHTTAFAKEAELNRGTVRTVDYARATLEGPLSKWLDMEYRMARPEFKETTVYLPDSGYEGFVTLNKTHLPDEVYFEAIGAGGPAEEQQKRTDMLNSAQLALSIDQMKIQMGGQPSMDLNQLIKHVLRNGGWSDVDVIVAGEEPSQGSAEQQPVQQISVTDPTEAGVAALEAISG